MANWRDEFAERMPGLQGPLPDPHVDPEMARVLDHLLTTSTPERKGDWQREDEEDRAQKRRPSRKAERTRKDPEYARIEDARETYPLALRSSFARMAVVLTREQAILTSEQGHPRTQDALSAALGELRSQMGLFDAFVQVSAPYALAGAKQKAPHTVQENRKRAERSSTQRKAALADRNTWIRAEYSRLQQANPDKKPHWIHGEIAKKLRKQKRWQARSIKQVSRICSKPVA